jgi:hypothetical protein
VCNRYWGNDADEGLTRSMDPDVGASVTQKNQLSKLSAAFERLLER